MRFVYHRIQALPRLSWCAEIKEGTGVVLVFHGPWVETREAFFVEGAWDGAFEDGGFDQTDLLMGSGARILEGEVLFAAPCHTLERLFVLRTNDGVIVSPSLAFLLRKAGVQLDPGHIQYQADLLRLVLRLENHVGHIPLAEGKQVMVVHYRNLVFDHDLDMRIQSKTRSRAFRNFLEYRQFLVSSLRAVVQNATAPTRDRRYQPIATVSSGYDSNGCAAIASEVGCKVGVTFRDARQNHESDSGSKTGTLLGLEMKERPRNFYKNLPGVPEAEFLATGDLGQDLLMAGFEEEFCERLVIIGTHGDRVWDRHARNVCEDIVREDMAACCLTDFKFRVGFVLVPLAFFGCVSHPSVHRISNSPEMAPWCTSNPYDRPIPRRIVEERGVPRSLFGQKKRQVTVLLNSTKRISDGLKSESLISFKSFYHGNKNRRNSFNQFRCHLLFRCSRAWSLVAMKLHGLSSRLGKPIHLPSPIPQRYRHHPGMPSFLVHWALPLVQARYTVAVEAPEFDVQDSSAGRFVSAASESGLHITTSCEV